MVLVDNNNYKLIKCISNNQHVGVGLSEIQFEAEG